MAKLLSYSALQHSSLTLFSPLLCPANSPRLFSYLALLLASGDFLFYAGFDATDHGTAAAWNGSCSCNAGPGDRAVPPSQRGPSPWRGGHMPLTQLPVPLAPSQPCLKKSVDVTGEGEERFTSSPSSHPLWTSISSLGQRLYLSPGLAW